MGINKQITCKRMGERTKKADIKKLLGKMLPTAEFRWVESSCSLCNNVNPSVCFLNSPKLKSEKRKIT